ncbi:hypothetical protein Cni_G28909 [Canna indica]|uniref:GTD-binding domain-containing protein n=1 Tax=Canna indica TaxID=4628 RepID=A0AAQ3L6B0_9LILI|nr:hypothetical protein Cni_G28909 [Canna indica]
MHTPRTRRSRVIVPFHDEMKKNLSFCFEMCGNMRSKNGHLFFTASAFGILAVLWSCLALKWRFGVESRGFPSLLIAYNLFVFVSLLFLGSRVWYLGFRFEALDKFLWVIPTMKWSNDICTDGAVCASCDAKIESWKKSPSKRLKRNKEQNRDEGRRECNELDEEDDLTKLKEKLAEERKLRAAAVAELEKERAAASSAANEAMAKIVHLQNEKGEIEREARLYQEMAEQKKLYDQQVIETLHWVIMKLEAESGEHPSQTSQDFVKFAGFE